ncbi:27469_t:CDS:1, partial [Racocetra persica]
MIILEQATIYQEQLTKWVIKSEKIAVNIAINNVISFLTGGHNKVIKVRPDELFNDDLFECGNVV